MALGTHIPSAFLVALALRARAFVAALRLVANGVCSAPEAQRRAYRRRKAMIVVGDLLSFSIVGSRSPNGDPFHIRIPSIVLNVAHNVGAVWVERREVCQSANSYLLRCDPVHYGWKMMRTGGLRL